MWWGKWTEVDKTIANGVGYKVVCKGLLVLERISRMGFRTHRLSCSDNLDFGIWSSVLAGWATDYFLVTGFEECMHRRPMLHPNIKDLHVQSEGSRSSDT